MQHSFPHYTPECIEAIKENADKCPPEVREEFYDLIHYFEDSVYWHIDSEALPLIWYTDVTQEGLFEGMRLPYKRVILEYLMDSTLFGYEWKERPGHTRSRKRIIYLEEIDLEDEKDEKFREEMREKLPCTSYLWLSAAFYLEDPTGENDGWAVCPGSLLIPLNGMTKVSEWYSIDDTKDREQVQFLLGFRKGYPDFIPTLPVFEKVMDLKNDEEAKQSVINDLCEEIRVALAWLAIMSTGVDSEVVPAPEKLNKKREKRGKPRIPEYRLMNLHRTRSGSGEKTGTHSSPVAHWRRGHVRRQHYGYKNQMTKRIWIKPTIVAGKVAEKPKPTIVHA